MHSILSSPFTQPQVASWLLRDVDRLSLPLSAERKGRKDSKLLIQEPASPRAPPAAIPWVYPGLRGAHSPHDGVEVSFPEKEPSVLPGEHSVTSPV